MITKINDTRICMKNVLKLLGIIALTAIISGCARKTASQSEIGEIDTDGSLADASKILVDVSWVNESEYDPSSVHLFINNNNPKIKFTASVPLKDFRWVSIQHDEENEGFEVADVLFHINEFLPQKPLVVTFGEVGVYWTNAISYLDENGERKYFALWNNDYGPEDERYNGGLSLSEFTPLREDFLFTPIIIGQYRNTEDTDGSLILDIAEDSYKFNVNGVLYTGTYEVYYSYDTWYVSLPNIKWAHNWVESYNKAQITSDEELDNLDQDKMADKETYGVDLWIENNELVFQNYGNSMAPYEIFSGIGDKFVKLMPTDEQRQRYGMINQ